MNFRSGDDLIIILRYFKIPITSQNLLHDIIESICINSWKYVNDAKKPTMELAAT